MDVALATCVELPEPDHDEAPLLEALRARGLDAAPLAWDDPGADFSAARITLLRSTWNYPWNVEAFLSWAEHVATVSHLVNGIESVRWNHDKRYLLELEARGVPIAPTELVPRRAPRALSEILASRGWDDVVVKPAISAASYRTARVRRDTLAEGEAHLAGLLADRDALVQRYLSSVEDHGERSLIWVEGELTHAVRKSPRFGSDDEDVGAAVPIGEAERALAELALSATPLEPTYARIDVAPGPEGTPVLMELELMEPSLFFPQGPRGLTRLADSVERQLSILYPSAK